MSFGGVPRTVKGRSRAGAVRLALGLTLAAGGVLSQTPVPASPRLGPSPSDAIGTAAREEDGSIVLTLRAEGPGGLLGDAQFRYAPSDPDYGRIARHVGPIPRGGAVLVLPFEAR